MPVAVCVLYKSAIGPVRCDLRWSSSVAFAPPQPRRCPRALPFFPGVQASLPLLSGAGRAPRDRPAAGLLGARRGELRVGPVFVGPEDLSVVLPRPCARWPIRVEPCQPPGLGTWEVSATSEAWPSDVGSLVRPVLNYVVEINVPPSLPVRGR